MNWNWLQNTLIQVNIFNWREPHQFSPNCLRLDQETKIKNGVGKRSQYRARKISFGNERHGFILSPKSWERNVSHSGEKCPDPDRPEIKLPDRARPEKKKKKKKKKS